MVAVLNKDSYPLMPCTPRKARILLAQKKAKIVQTNPFTIKLKYGSSGYTQKEKQNKANPAFTASISQKKEIPTNAPKTKSVSHTRKNNRCKNRKCLKEAASFSKKKGGMKRWGKTNLNRHKRRKYA